MLDIFKKNSNKRFGEIAIGKGLASESDIREALEIQKEYDREHNKHKAIGSILTEKGVLTPNDVRKILDEQKGHMSTMAWFTALFGLSR